MTGSIVTDRDDGMGMKTKLVIVVMSCGMVFGLVSGCASGTGDGASGEPSESVSVSVSPSESGVDSHTFEGDGGKDYIETEAVELSGKYNVVWEISGNVAVDGSDGIFDASLTGNDLYPVTVVTKNVAEGSGEKVVTMTEPGEYHLETYSQPESHWKVTLTRAE